MHICFVTQEYPEETGWGGIGTYTKTLAIALTKKGHDVTVIARSLSVEKAEMDGAVRVIRICPYFSLKKLPWFWRLNRVWEGYHLAVFWTLLKLERIEKIDLIETPAINGETLLFQIFRNSIPVVVRIHSLSNQALYLNVFKERISLKLHRLYEKLSVRMTEYLTAPSSAIVRDNADDLSLSNRQIVVIPNAVDTDYYSVAGTRKISGLRVVYAGRLEMKKGVHILASAIRIIADRCPALGVTYEIVGSDGIAPDGGSMQKWILEQVGSSLGERIKFRGVLESHELRLCYQNSDVIVVPSLYESFGLVILEAMSCGKPVVASAIGGPMEILEDGKTGILVHAGDQAALADGMLRLLCNASLRATIGAAARKTVEVRYSSEIIVEKMIQYYNSVLVGQRN